MVFAVSLTHGDVMRYIAATEIFLSMGFMIARTLKVDSYYLRALSVSYIMYAVGCLIFLHFRLHHAITWRTPYILIAATIAIAAQIYLWLCERRYRAKRKSKSS